MRLFTLHVALLLSLAVSLRTAVYKLVKTDSVTKEVQYTQGLTTLKYLIISKHLLHFRTETLKLRAVETVASDETEFESRPSFPSPQKK